MAEPSPCICLTLALAVDPFEYYAIRVKNIFVTLFRVVRDSVIVQVPCNADLSLPQHLAFRQHIPRLLCPVCQLLQALSHLLAARAAFDLEAPFPGLPAIMRKSQKGELLRFLTSLVRTLTSKASKLNASCFLSCQFQPKPVEPF